MDATIFFFSLVVFLLLGGGIFAIWVFSRPNGVLERLIENRQQRLNSLSESFIQMTEEMAQLKAKLEAHDYVVTSTKDMIVSRMASFESRYGKAEASAKKEADLSAYFPTPTNPTEVIPDGR